MSWVKDFVCVKQLWCMKFRLVIFLVFLSCAYSFAQTSTKKSRLKKEKQEIDRGATYAVDKSKVKKKEVKHSISKSFDKKVEEYEKRMQANVKKNAKMAKEMQKPQYSDPTYFGHKKKPKKRPAGKKKFCKECQMYH